MAAAKKAGKQLKKGKKLAKTKTLIVLHQRTTGDQDD
jgi:hypothetical protein